MDYYTIAPGTLEAQQFLANAGRETLDQAIARAVAEAKSQGGNLRQAESEARARWQYAQDQSSKLSRGESIQGSKSSGNFLENALSKGADALGDAVPYLGYGAGAALLGAGALGGTPGLAGTPTGAVTAPYVGTGAVTGTELGTGLGTVSGMTPAQIAVANAAPAQVVNGPGLLDTVTSSLGKPGLNLGNVGLGLTQAGLGYLGAGKQADAYKDVAQQNLALGASSRGKLEASYQPGFNLMSQPGYGDAFNRAADIATRQWGAKGNPAGNPTIQAGILNDVWSQNYLPALSSYRGQLGQFGGLGLNTSGAAQLGGAQTAGGGLNAIGYGLGTVMSGNNPMDDYIKALTEHYKLNIGGQAYKG